MKTTTTTAVETPTTTKAAPHSPCTVAVSRCRLAAIAATAADSWWIATAWAKQAEEHMLAAKAAAADDTKDKRAVEVAERWAFAADCVAATWWSDRKAADQAK